MERPRKGVADPVDRTLEPAFRALEQLNEAFARSALYLTVLSASVLALALVSRATGFDKRLAGVALLLMSVVVFVGSRRWCGCCSPARRKSSTWQG